MSGGFKSSYRIAIEVAILQRFALKSRVQLRTFSILLTGERGVAVPLPAAG